MAEPSMTLESSLQRRQYLDLYLVCVGLMVMILVLDLSIPLGVAMGVPYTIVVLISLWIPHRRGTLILTMICSLLIIVAFFTKPPVDPMWKVICNRGLALMAIWVTAFLGLQLKTIEKEREKVLMAYEAAQEQVRILRGFLPICAACKKIRDDRGHWNQMEEYITNHSEAVFSHGICPECEQKLYPEYCSRDSSNNNDEWDN